MWQAKALVSFHFPVRLLRGGLGSEFYRFCDRTVFPTPICLRFESASMVEMGPCGFSRRGNSIVAVAKNFEAAVESRRNVVQTSQHEWWSYKFAHIVAWIVQILFTLASLVLLALWIRHVHPEAYVVTFFVMSIAAAAYFAKVTGMGDAVIAGRKVHRFPSSFLTKHGCFFFVD